MFCIWEKLVFSQDFPMQKRLLLEHKDWLLEENEFNSGFYDQPKVSSTEK